MVTHLPSATLRQLVKLSERKEALMAQIQEIDREMARLQNEHPAPADTGHRAPVTVSRANRKVSQTRRPKRTA